MPVSVRNILAPIDLSSASDPVCEFATEMARQFDARLTVLYVVEGLEELRGLNLPTVSYDDITPDLEAQGREKLAQFALRQLKGAGEVQQRVTHGEPYEQILTVAREIPADVIVMGTHGRKGLERAIFGSTAERVIRGSPVPVVAVPVKG